MTHIKICGITNLADARYASGAGADMLGFIQHEASPRFIDPGLARDIIAWIHGAESVGVFVDRPADEVNNIVAGTGFDWIQLHGSETPAYCSQIDGRVIKAVRIFPGTSASEIDVTLSAYSDVVDAFLVDTGSSAAPGGTGETFDWSVLEDVDFPKPWLLAGGLNPGNILRALERLDPWGVDVASGVEERPGQKDFGAIDRFVQAVRGEVANR
ncbi:MAG: phosphoribosylanthranilate isomerase [Rhodothermales bacterium]